MLGEAQQPGSWDYEATAMNLEGVLVFEPLEPVHHEPLEGSTKRV
jgi:hypothetical protein